MKGWLQREAIQLTPRERDIVELLLMGCDNTEISKNLNISPRTVKAHFSRLYLRFGIIGGIKRVKLASYLYRRHSCTRIAVTSQFIAMQESSK
jgi:DNA-binding NarL/FixJ family response regulator